MNVSLLREISAIIQRDPEKFDMRYLHSDSDGGASSMDCGTAHCICGWAACLLGSPRVQNGTAGHLAFDIRPDQANRLFFDRFWPEPFRSAYSLAKSRSGRAEIAAARIEHFIATDGRE